MRKLGKKQAGAIAALAAIGVIAGAFALFSTSFEVENKFKINTLDARFVEDFDAPDIGDNPFISGSYDKSGHVENTGDTPIKAKATVTAEWIGSDGTTVIDNEYEVGKYAATLDFGTTADLTSYTGFHSTGGDANGKWKWNQTDTCFYYNGKTGTLAANTNSDAILSKVLFSTDLAVKTTSKKWYVKEEYDAYQTELTGNPSAVEPTSYQTQDEAKAAAITYKAANPTASGKVTYVEVSSYASDNAGFKGATLKVTIAGEIISGDAQW